MALAFTVEQFHSVFRDDNAAVSPAPWFLVALALAAVGAVWRLRTWSGVAAHVEDSDIAGNGRLDAKLFGLFTVANSHGDGEIACGEFMRCFAESPWYPTALLPSQGVRWEAVDDACANATIVDDPISLTLLFRFNDAGLIALVRAGSRGAGLGKDGMLVPMAGEAAWVRPEGRKAYFVGHVQKLRYEFLP